MVVKPTGRYRGLLGSKQQPRLLFGLAILYIEISNRLHILKIPNSTK